MELYGAAEQRKTGVVICARKNDFDARLCVVYATGKPTPIHGFAWHVGIEHVRAYPEPHGFVLPARAFARHCRRAASTVTFCAPWRQAETVVEGIVRPAEAAENWLGTRKELRSFRKFEDCSCASAIFTSRQTRRAILRCGNTGKQWN